MSCDLLELQNLTFGWQGSNPFALDVSEFSVAAGERVLLLGESGSGKSTLLSVICGVLRPLQGQVRIAGQDIFELSDSERDQFRAEHIGIIFQQFNLLPFGTVLDNIALPLRFAPERRKRVGNIRAAAQDLCQSLSLSSDLLPIKASLLSVGQQQRVAVARALIGTPPLILADEPTSALDASAQSKFLDLLFNQCESHGSTLIMVSHDARLGVNFDRVVELSGIAKVRRGAA